jgi:hypothetical protein
MKIKELFAKPVDRPIDGVIKADDKRNLRTELEEYVVTRDVAKGLSTLTERYLDDATTNGVWISGFFGSGKSHLLKMLSLVLDGTELDPGVSPADILLPKVDDEIIRADLRKAANIPSRSVLFNIDQKFDGIGGDHTAPILEVFVKVLNELQGYYGQSGYIAQFEHDLDVRREFDAFKKTYLEVNGREWVQDRGAITTARRAAFGNAYAVHGKVPTDEAYRIITQVREDYRVSIESFAGRVKDYIATQPAGFRLNFFIDEIGQFIGQDSKRMLNLQTVAETLGTTCDGRAWVFVTSQADLEGVLGDFRGLSGQDISKIQGRFKTKITLASADVREVIQKRLLAKTEPEPEVLTNIWDAEKENLQTLFRFGDGSRSFNGWRGSDEFCSLYPFHPYQFDLFQESITQLSKHSVFTGKYLSVGERSMLAVFQEVAKFIRDDTVGHLATFDRMYDGIAASIRGDMQTSIKLAENQLGDGMKLRILKSLFLLKWVKEFKATARNIALLLIDSPDIDIGAHDKVVKEALAQLEAESYLQRNGDTFEFLTDAEKDIEQEIKSTAVDEASVAAYIGNTLFADVLRDPRIRYEANGVDYPYARKLDDALVGKDADIALNIVTPDHDNHADLTVLASQNMGRNELLAVLPADARVGELARQILKTEKYIRQNSGGADETRSAILNQRNEQNGARKREIVVIATDLLSRAPIYLNGSKLASVGTGEPRGRYAKAFQELVAFAYPNLKMLKGSYDESALSQTLLAKDDLLSGGAQPLSEAESDVLTYVRTNQNDGQKTTVEEIVRTYGRRPNGWPPAATLVLLARLYRAGKLEMRTGELLDAKGLLDALKNSRSHGTVRVRLQEQVDAAQVTALKQFHHAFFDRANDGTEWRSAARNMTDAMEVRALALTQLHDQASRYAFLASLMPVIDRMNALAIRDQLWLLNHQAEFSAELLAAKDDLLVPIESFMHGPQRKAYDDAINFLREEEANFGDLPSADIQPLRDLASSLTPYRGTGLPTAKQAVERLRAKIAELVSVERNRALEAIDGKLADLSSQREFKALSVDDQQAVLAPARRAREEIESARFVTGIRDRLQRYVSREYPEQLTHAARLAVPPAAPITADGSSAPNPAAPAVEYISASRLKPDTTTSVIATEVDLDMWLSALRAAALTELMQGKRITI